jgi:hypothetical protein
VARVKAEAVSVEREVSTLRALQTQMASDPVLRVSNFRNQPLPKKALLVAALLFFVRGGADGISAVGDPGMHIETACGVVRTHFNWHVSVSRCTSLPFLLASLALTFSLSHAAGVYGESALAQLGVSVAALAAYLFL